MISKFTRIYVRRYTDNGQVCAYVEWIDKRGKSGRTEGHINLSTSFGHHMHALFAAAKRQGLHLERETW